MGKFVRVPSSKEEGYRTINLSIRRRDIPANVEVVAGYIVNNNEVQQRKREERRKQDPETKKKIVRIGAILVAGLLSLQLVTATKEIRETEITPINGIYYEVENPSIASWALVNAYGQELMTNVQNMNKNEREVQGISYSPNEQADREQKSVGTNAEFESFQVIVRQNMAVLKNPNSTQEEIRLAIVHLKEASDRITAIVSGKQDIIREAGRGFETNARVLPDNRTETEIEVKNEAVTNFYTELGLSEANTKFINDLYTRIQNGEEIDIQEITQELDGDYVITGESCREVVREEKLRGIRAILEHLGKAFSKDKGTNSDEGR